MSERRIDPRVPVELQLTQYIDNHPIVCTVNNLSASGLLASHPVAPFARSSRHIQLELELPEVSEPLWLKGEVVYDSIGLTHHETGIRFVAMAPAHRQSLLEWIHSTGQAC